MALLHMRYHRFGDALRTLERAGPFAPEAARYYDRLLAIVRQVGAFCDGELYPECLLDVILEEAVARPIGYAPEPAHVATVTSTLAQGGSERQTVNIVRGLSADPRIARQTVLVRNSAGQDGFFKPVLDPLPIALHVYGERWHERSDLSVLLPEIDDRPRLKTAIDLLPGGMREELGRVTRRLLDARPQVAHLRQDLYIAALACALAGVPRFFVHRGSLARVNWAHTRLQADTVLRPMRHVYRALLARTPFFMINNSEVGRQSDIAWTAWPDPGRFKVVHNAVDFARLGPDRGRNVALRAELGIPAHHDVIGGAFRLVEVKRPLLWLEIARQVLEQRPGTHFIIAGEGAMGEEMQAFAARHGFGDRLHMPGAVADVGSWFRAMDMVLLTSDREGMPNVLVEAQHFGVPVVSSDVGGARETLDDGVTGHLLPADAGAPAYAERIVRSLGDPDWRARAAALGPAFVSGRFGPEQAVERLIDIYAFDQPTTA
jgi:glycosyltransferase involved in cell wall biosynthesis